MKTEAFIERAVLGVFRLAARITPGGIAALGLIVAALLPRAWIEPGPSFCPFRMWSGLPCPGCGLTRSVVALAHGDLAASLYFHPLGVAIVVGLLAIMLAELVLLVRRTRSNQTVGSVSTMALLERGARGPLALVGIGVIAVVWLVRLPLFLNGAWTI